MKAIIVQEDGVAIARFEETESGLWHETHSATMKKVVEGTEFEEEELYPLEDLYQELQAVLE